MKYVVKITFCVGDHLEKGNNYVGLVKMKNTQLS